MGGAYGSIVRKRKSAPPDPLDPLLDLLVVHDQRAAAQAADGLLVVVTSVEAVAVTAGLPLVPLHLHAKATGRVDDLAVPGPIAMPDRARRLDETSPATTGAVASVANEVAVAQPRAKVAVAVVGVVGVVGAARITTRSHRPAVSSRTSTIGISLGL
jgi:hypothetical protein